MIHSGTIGAAVTVLNRGIPALAVSAAGADANATGLLSALVLRVVAAIDQRGRVLLPHGVGLSVNIPTLDPARTAISYRIAFTQVSTDPDPAIRFLLNGDEIPSAPPAPEATPRNAGNEHRAIGDGQTITVSPIQGTFQASPEFAAQTLAQLRPLFAVTAPIANPQLSNLSVRGFVGTGNAA
jgi:broad specificity polyphosphatase/5'/3'-nucleotidase SurE